MTFNLFGFATTVEAANGKIDRSLASDYLKCIWAILIFIFWMQLFLDASDCMKNLTTEKKQLEMDQSRMDFKIVRLMF